jgi:uncharacterized RDD family membrane protein YckC
LRRAAHPRFNVSPFKNRLNDFLFPFCYREAALNAAFFVRNTLPNCVRENPPASLRLRVFVLILHRCAVQFELSFGRFTIKSPRNFMETNYKIIGGDGREYGPVTLEELKSWIRDGRVGRQTHVWRSDLNSWLPASQYQELQSDIAPLQSSASGGEGEFEPVGFWPRVAAYILDQLILGVVGYIIFPAPPSNITSIPEMMTLMGPRMAYSFLISALYYVGMNGQFGATLGKMVIGAKIVRADGSRIGFGIAFLRMLATIISSLTLGIGYLMVAFREDKRALHDLIVGTRVIYKR